MVFEKEKGRQRLSEVNRIFFLITLFLFILYFCILPTKSECAETIGAISGGTTYISHQKDYKKPRINKHKYNVRIGKGRNHYLSEEVAYHEIIEDSLDNLKKAHLAFNIEEKMDISESKVPFLVISVTKDVKELAREYNLRFCNNTGCIQVVNFVEAELNGLDFDIKELSKRQQTVNAHKDMIWQWELRPKKEGQLKLNLTVNSLLSIAGKDKFMNITSVRKDIFVEVGFTQKAVKTTGDVSDYLKKIWPILLILLGMILLIIPARYRNKITDFIEYIKKTFIK